MQAWAAFVFLLFLIIVRRLVRAASLLQRVVFTAPLAMRSLYRRMGLLSRRCPTELANGWPRAYADSKQMIGEYLRLFSDYLMFMGRDSINRFWWLR